MLLHGVRLNRIRRALTVLFSQNARCSPQSTPIQVTFDTICQICYNYSMYRGDIIEANTKYFSVREVADRLGVSVMTVGRWLKSGKLNGYKFGKTIRISEADLGRLIKDSQMSKKPDNDVHNPDFSKGKSVLKHWGTWVGPKEEYYKILEAIQESRSDAEF